MFSTLVIIAVVLLIALAAYIASRPNSFRVSRTVSINAPAEKIFPLINDFHNWTTWSPYEKIDPALKRTYGGASAGRGAVYEWEGNSKAGKGRMEITETNPSRITTKLDFDKPMKAHNTAEFTLEPKGTATEVTWAMYGPNSFMTKAMQTFMSVDTLVGKDFETGLANLKTIAEKNN